MPYPVIADSGANYHMFRDRSFFEVIHPAKGIVLLGDGVTTLPIQGVATVKCQVESSILTIPDVRYIPELSKSIYSLSRHIQTKDHKLESSYDEGLFIIFPRFCTKAIIGKDDIYLDFQPLQEHSLEESSEQTSIHFPASEKCNHVTEFHQTLEEEISYLDKLLQNLREYYSVVKTKCQLGLDVPAGFQRNTSYQQNYRYTTLPRKSKSIQPDDDLALSQEFLDELMIDSNASTPVHSNVISDPASPSISSVPSQHIPLVRSVDKVSSSLPKVISMSEDFLQGSVGFRRVDTLRRHFDHLYQDTVRFDNTPLDASLTPGDVATMHKKPRNTVPVPRSDAFGSVIHMDIIFGPEISAGNIHYGIIFTDRYSRMTYLYPLHNLTSDIPKQLQSFFAHIGMVPKRLVTDFDLKLIGG